MSKKKSSSISKSTQTFTSLIVLNLIFFLLEFVGGLVTRSTLLMTDSLHDFGDALSLLISSTMDKDARTKRETHSYTYGLKRLRLFSSFISSIILLLTAAVMTPYVLDRIFKPVTVDAIPLIWLSIIGLVVHLVFVLRSKFSKKDPNSHLTTYQLVEDLICWLIVLVGAAIIMIFNVPILDPILSLVLIIYILGVSIRDFYQTLVVFLQGVPADIDLNYLTEKIEALPHVLKVSDFHVWALDNQNNVGTLVVKINKDLTWRRRLSIKQAVRETLAKLDVREVTIEFDENGSDN